MHSATRMLTEYKIIIYKAALTTLLTFLYCQQTVALHYNMCTNNSAIKMLKKIKQKPHSIYTAK